MVEGSVLVNPTADDYGAAATRVRAYPDQPVTLADVVLVVVSVRLQCPVWTYDYHFDLMQAPVWR
jgi:predicted nucleic acid-binding protein